MTELLPENLEYILAGLALVVWVIRGEAKTNANAAEIRRLWKQRKEDKDAADGQRHEDLISHKESRDATNEILQEVQRDIKTLLRSFGKGT